MTSDRQQGFTLIELVVVISILAILAAVALPKFVDIQGDARGAALAGVRGGFNSSVQLVHAKWLAQGGTGTTVTLEGATVNVTAGGYPDLGAAGQATAAALYGVLMSSPLPGNWSSSEAGTVATFTLPGSGGGSFTYDDSTGQVS